MVNTIKEPILGPLRWYRRRGISKSQVVVFWLDAFLSRGGYRGGEELPFTSREFWDFVLEKSATGHFRRELEGLF